MRISNFESQFSNVRFFDFTMETIKTIPISIYYDFFLFKFLILISNSISFELGTFIFRFKILIDVISRLSYYRSNNNKWSVRRKEKKKRTSLKSILFKITITVDQLRATVNYPIHNWMARFHVSMRLIKFVLCQFCALSIRSSCDVFLDTRHETYTLCNNFPHICM